MDFACVFLFLATMSPVAPSGTFSTGLNNPTNIMKLLDDLHNFTLYDCDYDDHYNHHYKRKKRENSSDLEETTTISEKDALEALDSIPDAPLKDFLESLTKLVNSTKGERTKRADGEERSTMDETDKENLQLVMKMFNITEKDLLNFTDKIRSNRSKNFSSIPDKTVMKIPESKKKMQTASSVTLQKDVGNGNYKYPEWISRPLREALSGFRVRVPMNEKCNMHSNLIDLHVKNATLWAVRMEESSQSELIGLMGGTAYQMGNFEECIATDAFGVKGRYCLARFDYALTEEDERMAEASVAPDDTGMKQSASVWETLVAFRRDEVRLNRQSIRWGLCVPHSCSASDVEYSLNETLLPAFSKRNLRLNITVDPQYCTTDENIPYTKGFYVTITFMVMLLVLNVASSMYDMLECYRGKYNVNLGDSSVWRDVFAAFSAIRNIHSLAIYDKSSQVKIINGQKLVLMLLIVYGHGLMYFLGNPHFNPINLEEVYRKGADVSLVNTNVVDVFFAISGFLTFYYGYKPMKIGGPVFLSLFIIFRYLRLMPVLGILIAYVIHVFPYTGDGPLWLSVVNTEVENCRQNWWLNFLLANNFVNSDKQCILVGWYITNDMILCILASFLLLAIVKRPKFGLLVTAIIFFGNMALTFYVTYSRRYDGIFKLSMHRLENPRIHEEYNFAYVALFTRCGPYLVGFFTSYITIKLQEKKFKFPYKIIILASIIAVIIGEGSQYYAVVFYQYGRPFNILENAIYACVHRILFAACWCWFIMAYLTSGLGFFDSFINHPVFIVCGRITYSVFLMNTFCLMTLTASTRWLTFMSYKTIMFLIFGTVITSYATGMLFYLYAEAPFSVLTKIMQKKLTKMFEKEIAAAKDKRAKKADGITEKIPA